MWNLKNGKLHLNIGPYQLTVTQLPDGNFKGSVTDGTTTEDTLFNYQTIPYCQAATIRVARGMALRAYHVLSALSQQVEGKLNADLS